MENNLKNTDPWVLKWLKNKEDAILYSRGSHKKIILKCPECGTEKEVIIYNFIRAKGFKCPCCDDGISYPNKFMRSFLKQLPIQNLQYEYCINLGNNDKVFYDDYFEYQNKKFLVEIDGSQHQRSYQEQNYLFQLRHSDELKTEIAEKNNFILIRIDALESSLEYIKNKIENSNFSKIFDLSQIDWDKCNLFGCNSLILKTCEIYNKHAEWGITKIANYLNISTSSVQRYLKKGAELNLCDYNLHKVKSIASLNMQAARREKLIYEIEVYDENNNYIGSYKGNTDASNHLNELYPNKNFTPNGISTVLSGRTKHHRGFSFKKVDKKGEI